MHFVSKNFERKRQKTSKNSRSSVFLTLFLSLFGAIFVEKERFGSYFRWVHCQTPCSTFGNHFGTLSRKIPRENDEKPRKIAILACFCLFFVTFFVTFLWEKSFLGLIFVGYIVKHFFLLLVTILAFC